MEGDGDQSLTDVVHGTPSPDVIPKYRKKGGASNLGRNHPIHNFSSSTSSIGSMDLSTYSIDSSSPDKSYSFLHGDRSVMNDHHLPLPSDANFAAERAKAIRQKKLKDKTSPFKLPKHANSDFVKSSALLNSGEYNHGIKNRVNSGVHKRKSDSANDNTGVAISPVFNGGNRIKKASTMGWPSSSDSSDDEIDRNYFHRKKKRFKGSTNSPLSGSSNILVVNDDNDQCNNRHQDNRHSCQHEKKHKAKTSGSTNYSKSVKGSMDLKNSRASNVPVSDTNATMISPVSYNPSPRKGNPIIQDDSYIRRHSHSSVLNGDSPLSVGTASPVFSGEAAGRIGSTFCTPKMSNIRVTNHDKDRSQIRHRCEPGDLNTAGGERSDSPNFIDLTTPETSRYVNQVKQMEDDEAMARTLQEELDKEFALALAQQQESLTVAGPATSGGGGHPGGWTSPPTFSGSYVRPPASRYGEADSSEILQMMADIDPEREPAGRSTGTRRRTRATASRRDVGDASQEILEMLQHIQPQLDVRSWNIISSSTMRRGRRGAIASPNIAGNDYENLLQLGELIGEARETGLSKAEMSRLPIICYKKTENGEGEAECNICMCNYEEGDSQKMLPCFHSYHARCIDKWIAKNATCPVCRVEIKL